MSSIWYDYEDAREEEIANSVMAFTGKCEFDSDSNDEDIFDEEITETHKLFYIKWFEACMTWEK